MISTIGHGLSEIKDFFDTLKDNGIDTLIDVRSKPYSRRAPQFNRSKLEAACENENIYYHWRGESLGGFGVISGEVFMGGITELIERSSDKNLVIMCSEGDYKKCHRYQKITPELEKAGIPVVHLKVNKKRDSTQKTLL